MLLEGNTEPCEVMGLCQVAEELEFNHKASSGSTAESVSQPFVSLLFPLIIRRSAKVLMYHSREAFNTDVKSGVPHVCRTCRSCAACCRTCFRSGWLASVALSRPSPPS